MLRKTLFIYLNTIVFCFCSASLATFENNRVLSLSESYDQPKNIGFAGFVGGSSHYTWVLTILDELKDRGHNVTFFTKVCILNSSDDIKTNRTKQK
jgi:hypothetical protein